MQFDWRVVVHKISPNDGWRQWVVWLNVTVGGILAFEMPPLLYNCSVFLYSSRSLTIICCFFPSVNVTACEHVGARFLASKTKTGLFRRKIVMLLADIIFFPNRTIFSPCDVRPATISTFHLELWMFLRNILWCPCVSDKPKVSSFFLAASFIDGGVSTLGSSTNSLPQLLHVNYHNFVMH